jgi:protein TonB
MKEKTNYLTMTRPNAKLANYSALIFGLFFIALSLQSCKTRNPPASVYEIQDDAIFTVVEQMPSFPGGVEARTKFLMENIIYPLEAREKGYQGTVYLTFVVEPDGRITNLQMLKGVHPSIDAEAVRVVKLMPNWEPGKQRSKPVRVQYNMPIKFTLQG